MKKISSVLCCLILTTVGFSQVNSPPQTVPISTTASGAGSHSPNYGNLSPDYSPVSIGRGGVGNPTIDYRKPNKQEQKVLEVESSYADKFKTFLEKKNTGIFRLLTNDCGRDNRILYATPECTEYTMPGGGAAFSFRANTHRIWRLADLTYKDGSFLAGSKNSHGIIGNLGDLDIETLTLESPTVRDLNAFTPVKKRKLFKAQFEKIEKGINFNNVPFSNRAEIKENSTYLLRVIAYQSRWAYGDFYYDRRIDILVAFRVIKKDDDGLTILWTRLNKKSSPRIDLEMPEEEAKKD